MKKPQMTIQQINEKYFQWLCDLVDRRSSASTKELMFYLHTKGFYWRLPNDDNRVIDAKQLREDFAPDDVDPRNLIGYVDDDGSCTMLEFLIGVAKRMDFIILDPMNPLSDNDPGVAKCFWMLINNLGLEIYSCDDPDIGKKRKLNDLILKKLVERSYGPDGKGGLFPLKHSKDDQRRVEVWYQMQSWINENFNI